MPNTFSFKEELKRASRGIKAPTWKSIFLNDIKDFADFISNEWPNIRTMIRRNITNPNTYLYVRSRWSAESLTTILVFKESLGGITILNRPDKVEDGAGTFIASSSELMKELVNIAGDIQFTTQMKLINEIHKKQDKFDGYIHTLDFFEISQNDLKISVSKPDVELFGDSKVGDKHTIKVVNSKDMQYGCGLYKQIKHDKYIYFEVNGFLGTIEGIRESSRNSMVSFLEVDLIKFSTENQDKLF